MEPTAFLGFYARRLRGQTTASGREHPDPEPICGESAGTVAFASKDIGSRRLLSQPGSVCLVGQRQLHSHCWRFYTTPLLGPLSHRGFHVTMLK